MNRRVVVSGVGVVAPNAIGVQDFEQAMRAGRSGIRLLPELQEKGFSCCIGGIPKLDASRMEESFTELERKQLRAHNLIYAILAAEEAWADAGLEKAQEEPHWDTGCVFGVGLSGVWPIRESVYLIDGQKVKRMGSHTVPQIMASGVSAYLGGRFGLGNWVFTNASACSTGTEAIRLASEHIRRGGAERMLCGSCESDGPYLWGGFDAMRVLTRRFNDRPEEGSRPMSAAASGFVPGGGAGALVLESLDSALARGARIQAEIVGGFTNSGGQRGGGSMTAPNIAGIERCIRGALAQAEIKGSQVDLISGHLTATAGDPGEITAWVKALERSGEDFPWINSLKSMIGHCLSGAGAIESVAAILQLKHQFVHPSINCEDLHPDIAVHVDTKKIPQTHQSVEGMEYVAKASFGFGDVNSVIILRKYDG